MTKTVDPDEFLGFLSEGATAMAESDDKEYDQVVQRLNDYVKKDETWIMFPKDGELVAKEINDATTEELAAWAGYVLPIGEWTAAAKTFTTQEKRVAFFFSIVSIRNACVIPAASLVSDV